MMTGHRHLSSEEILDRIGEGEVAPEVGNCEACSSEAASLGLLLQEMKRADSDLVATSDWDDLLVRRRIREALDREKPHRPSIFDRFAILRPALASVLVTCVAVAVLTPVLRDARPGTGIASLTPGSNGNIPSWTPLPDESEDEGLAVLAEWTPNEDELAIARCRAACLSGLSDREEESLLLALGGSGPRSPLTEGSPL